MLLLTVLGLGLWLCSIWPQYLHVRTYPAAIFSRDGRQIYYVQLDMKGLLTERPGLLYNIFSGCAMSLGDGCGETDYIRVWDEQVTIHRMNRNGTADEVLHTLPQPPSVDHTLATGVHDYFGGQDAHLLPDLNGGLRYEIHIGIARETAVISDSHPSWMIEPVHYSSSKWNSVPDDFFHTAQDAYMHFVGLEILIPQNHSSFLVLGIANHNTKMVTYYRFGSKKDRQYALTCNYDCAMGSLERVR